MNNTYIYLHFGLRLCFTTIIFIIFFNIWSIWIHSFVIDVCLFIALQIIQIERPHFGKGGQEDIDSERYWEIGYYIYEDMYCIMMVRCSFWMAARKRKSARNALRILPINDWIPMNQWIETNDFICQLNNYCVYSKMVLWKREKGGYCIMEVLLTNCV